MMMEPTPSLAGHPDMDYAEHERTYHRFLTLLRRSVIAIIVILIFMAWLLL